MYLFVILRTQKFSTNRFGNLGMILILHQLFVYRQNMQVNSKDFCLVLDIRDFVFCILDILFYYFRFSCFFFLF